MRGATRLRAGIQRHLRSHFLYRPEYLLGAAPGGNRWSAICAPIDCERPARQAETQNLVAFAIKVADEAQAIDLSSIAKNRPPSSESEMLNKWPGEHYRLLAAMAKVLGRVRIVEIGTYRGAGALSLLYGGESSVITYDLVPWPEIPETMLMNSDFSDRLEQRIGNLIEPSYLQSQLGTLREAQLVFVDAPKDGEFEYAFRDSVLPVLTPGTLVLFDDIRLLNMIELWRSLDHPAVDLTSFGHHTGSGLIRIEG